MTNAIRVLEPGKCLPNITHSSYSVHEDGTERQSIKDMDGNMPRPKIRGCSISDPFVFIVREDNSIGLFIGETERGKFHREDMSPMGDKVSLSTYRPPLVLTVHLSKVVKVFDWMFLYGCQRSA